MQHDRCCANGRYKGIEVNWVKDAVSKWVTLGVKESAILCFKESVVRIRLRREKDV